MRVAIVGGGIAGLALALGLHRHGLACRVFESARQVKDLGVGITLLPHGMRELTALGLEERLRAVAIENEESVFFNRHGQLIYREPRGRFAGYEHPELGIHRGTLHRVLYETAMERLPAGSVLIGHRCDGVEQDDDGVTVKLSQGDSRADVAVACDGFNSVVRRQFYPDERPAFTGINTWRGVTRRKPILGGRSYLRIGTVETGKIVIYPIADDVDGAGNQLVNWMAEMRMPGEPMNDWNKPGRVEDFIDIYRDWHFDWLDVPELIRGADTILEYPMVDKDPVERWTFGRVTFMGDAAHPMYPRGSNGAAQALIDARTLADDLAKGGDPREALLAYEKARLEATAKVVRTNRQFPPDYIIMKVDELTGGQPFANIDDVISQAELRELSDNYKRIAGFALEKRA
ncbi:MAG: flavin-dependent oxidoreductase [Burkholderiales bacterium]|nr:flavin-dependent oxidoreductase [Burkholderiales bacterium]